MNVIAILLALVQHAGPFIQLFLAIAHEVHATQLDMPGAPGADKSASVIAKVTPIAQEAGAATEHVQDIINSVVDISKKAGIGSWASPPDQPSA